MASAVIVLILAGGMIYLYNYTAEIRDEKKNDLQAIAELKLGQIVSWRKEKFGDAYVLSESPLFCEAVENWISHKNNLQLKGKILKRLNSFIQAYNYKNIVILSPSGKVLLTFDSELNDINHITKHFVIKSAHEKKLNTLIFITAIHIIKYIWIL
jgi:hypothetical protein